MERRASIGITGLVLALVLLVGVFVCWEGPLPAPVAVDGAGAMAPSVGAVSASEVEAGPDRNPLTEYVRIRVSDKLSGAPMAGVEVFLVELAERTPMTAGAKVIGATGPDGVLSIESELLGDHAKGLRRPGVACDHVGYLCTTIPYRPDRERYEFALSVERVLTVLCVDLEGNPMPGARLYLSRRAFGKVPVLSALHVGGLVRGHDFSLGVAEADHRGIAVMRGVAPGSYIGYGDCRDHMAIDKEWQGSAYVEIGDRYDMVCRMAALMVLWVAAPKSKVRNMMAMASSDPVGETSDNRQLLGTKAAEFDAVSGGRASGDLLYSAHVGIGASGRGGAVKSVSGRVRWQGYDDVWREVAMPYRPIEVARQLGPEDLPTGDAPTSNVRLTVLLKNSNGASLAGVPFRLLRHDMTQITATSSRIPAGGDHFTVSGATIHHVSGRWRLVAEGAEMAALLAPYEFDIPEGGDVVVPLRLAKDIGAVVFRGADRRVPPTSMRLTVWKDSRRLFNVTANGARTFSRWLPVGDYRVSYVINGVSPVQWKEFSITSLVDELTVDLDQY